MIRTTVFRLAVLGVTAAALAGCLPIMFDRDGNWRGQQPIGPAYGSASQGSGAAGAPILDQPAADAPEEQDSGDPVAE